MNCVDRYTGEPVECSVRSSRLVPVGVKKEKVDPSTKVERGYIPLAIRVQEMLGAGLRLVEERRARFDSIDLGTGDGEDIPLDPMREPGLDLVDVGKLATKAKKAVTALQERVAAKEKEASDAKAKAEFQAAVEAELQARQEKVKP